VRGQMPATVVDCVFNSMDRCAIPECRVFARKHHRRRHDESGGGQERDRGRRLEKPRDGRGVIYRCGREASPARFILAEFSVTFTDGRESYG
jgi:hypothetical protein